MRNNTKFKKLFSQGKRSYSALSMVPPQGRNVLYGLIGANLTIFVMWQTLGNNSSGQEFMAKNFMVSMRHIQDGRFYTLVTACFSHFNAAHLLFNMLGLYFFGPPVMMMLGVRRFLALYLAAGVTGNLVYVGDRLRRTNFDTRLARRNDSYVLGASGSIYALSVFYALEFPFQTWYLFGVVPVPGIVAVGGFIAWDLFMANSGRQSNLAHTAHLGGAAVGAAYYYYLTRRLFRRF
eukprot:Phypoly_transcript_16514.p1 GENE.Phypoly_transcript_16514~~Phypoly_transcript_16514.p1  ORF type:complete len:249 (+),score=15.56 Phypoly_transcript_16514:43-747(+)